MPSKMFSAKMMEVRKEKVDQLKQWILSAPVVGVVHGSLALATRVDSRPTLPTIDVPVLLVCGTEDPITGENLMRPIAEGIKQSNFVLVEGAGKNFLRSFFKILCRSFGSI